MSNAFDELLQAEPTGTVRPRARLSRRLPLVALILLLGGGGYFAYRALAKNGEQPPSYRTAKVDRGDIVRTVTATGTLSPRVTVTVGAQVSGRIQALYVDYNSRVKKGQVIARIDRRLLDAEVSRAKANLASARARLAQARAAASEAKLQYERDRALSKKNIVASAEVETKRASYLTASAEVKAAQAAVAQSAAALKLAKTNVDYTTIVSPIDGVVVSRSVDVGQTVAASLQAPTLFTIAQDLKKMEVHTSVAESDVGLIKEGMPVEFTVDAYPKVVFAGVVKQVRYEAQTVQNVVTYDAVVSVSNDALKLRPGMTANASFIVARRKDVLRVPSTATRWRPPGATKRPGKTKARARPGNKRSVFVLRGGEPERARVEVGLSDGKYFEVLSGELKIGDRVVVGLDEPGKGGDKGKSGSRRYRRRRIL